MSEPINIIITTCASDASAGLVAHHVPAEFFMTRHEITLYGHRVAAGHRSATRRLSEADRLCRF